MLSFAPNLKEKYSQKSDIIVQIINRWCDGKSIDILVWIPENPENFGQIPHNLGGKISVWVEKNSFEKISWGFISLAKEKFIFSHKDQVLTRCGCGKSFSFKTGNEMQDKIAVLRKKLKKSKTCA